MTKKEIKEMNTVIQKKTTLGEFLKVNYGISFEDIQKLKELKAKLCFSINCNVCDHNAKLYDDLFTKY